MDNLVYFKSFSSRNLLNKYSLKDLIISSMKKMTTKNSFFSLFKAFILEKRFEEMKR